MRPSTQGVITQIYKFILPRVKLPFIPSFIIQKTVKKTKIKTAQQLEHLKESLTHSYKEGKSKWKESKARLEIKVALKETK